MTYWPLATFLVATLGYIGFYTYSTQNQISFIKPEISVIIGIGLYNVIAIFLLIRPSKRNISPTVLRSFFTANYLNFLVLNPIIIGSLVLLDFQLFVVRKQYKELEKYSKKEKKKSFTELRRLVNKRPTYLLITDIVVIIIIGLISLFQNGNLAILVLAIHFISTFFYHLKKDLKRNLFIMLFCFLFIPVLTTKYYLKDINYTIFGLSKEYSSLSTTDNKIVKGFVTYKNANEIIITTDSNTIVLPQNKIKSITKIDTTFKPETGTEMLKDYYNDLIKNWP